MLNPDESERKSLTERSKKCLDPRRSKKESAGKGSQPEKIENSLRKDYGKQQRP